MPDKDSLMSRIVNAHMIKNRELPENTIDLVLTMTTPHKMHELAKELGFRFYRHKHEFFMHKFVQDEEDTEDEMMIEHAFYF